MCWRQFEKFTEFRDNIDPEGELVCHSMYEHNRAAKEFHVGEQFRCKISTKITFLFQCKIFWWHFYDHMNALYIKFCCSDGQNVYKTKKWILQKRNKKALILFILIASNHIRSHSKLFFKIVLWVISLYMFKFSEISS